MNISAAIKLAGAAVIGGIVAVIAVNATGSHKLRVGGEVYTHIVAGPTCPTTPKRKRARDPAA